MGMVCEIQALSSGQIAALYENADLPSEIAFAHSNGTAETLLDEPLRKQVDLDKSWDLLRFLMIQAGGDDDSPDRKDWSSELLLSDEDLDLGDIDMGFGPPYLRSIAETKKFAGFLQSLTMDQLLSHWNHEEMLKRRVYLISDRFAADEDRKLREYASSYYPILRDYVVKAAAEDCGLLLWIG
jgi:hypothetical protein